MVITTKSEPELIKRNAKPKKKMKIKDVKKVKTKIIKNY